MKQVLKPAFISSIPVLTGYLALGFGFGILLDAAGYGLWVAFIMSLTIYAGAMQFVAVGLLSGGTSLLTMAITTLMVNARHLFYGISMLPKYKGAGIRKAYLAFALTDETYSLLCSDHPNIPREQLFDYYLTVTLLNHGYWIAGSLIGSAVGDLVEFNREGIEFVLTALFITIFLEQWKTVKKHGPALIGLGATLVCLIVFGSQHFLIPAMIVIAILLCLRKEDPKHD